MYGPPLAVMRWGIMSAMMITAAGMMNPPWLFYSLGAAHHLGGGTDE